MSGGLSEGDLCLSFVLFFLSEVKSRLMISGEMLFSCEVLRCVCYLCCACRQIDYSKDEVGGGISLAATKRGVDIFSF